MSSIGLYKLRRAREKIRASEEVTVVKMSSNTGINSRFKAQEK